MLKKMLIPLISLEFLTVSAGCAILPDRLAYPTDMKTSENNQVEATIRDETLANSNKKKAIASTTGKQTSLASERQKDSLLAINAQKSDRGHNALTKVYDVPFNELWENVLETMLYLPIVTVDKASGIIISGWTMDKNLSQETLVAINIFGNGVRRVRYKYTVRIYDLGDKSEVTVIPFAQVIKNRRWHDGKPAVIITEKLMSKIIKKMEG